MGGRRPDIEQRVWVLVYSITPTGNANGSETPYVVRIAAAAYDPDLG
jgi:hypothetical protein